MSAAPQMRVVCAWCLDELGTRPCIPAMAGQISHGLCPECFTAQRAALAFLDTVRPPSPRAYLVETDAGLAVHRSASVPALASDRELGPEHFGESALTFSCRAGVGASRR